jgi:hypothetical protein
MEEWKEKLIVSDVHSISPTAKAKDVLLELRNMNNNYVYFFKFMMDEFQKLETIRTADTSKLADLKQTVEDKHSEYDEKFIKMEADLHLLQKRDAEREDKLTEMECRQRKLNLIIPGIQEKPVTRPTRQNVRGPREEETYSEIHQKVVTYLENKLGILHANSMIFRNIHRLGRRNAEQTRPRNVIVAFVQQPDVDCILQAAREKQDPTVSIRTDLPKQYNEIRNALLAIRAQYRDLPVGQKVKCKLVYIKFLPTLFKLVAGNEIKVEITRGDDGKYHEELGL